MARYTAAIAFIAVTETAEVVIRYEDDVARLMMGQHNYFEMSSSMESETWHLTQHDVDDRSNTTLMWANAADKSLGFEGVVRMSGLDVSHAVNNDWWLVSLETFEDAPQGWRPKLLSSCGVSSDIFLGGHCKLGGSMVIRKEYTDHLPPHEQLRLTLRAHFIDQWEGEVLWVKADGQVILTFSHSWCEKAYQSKCFKFGVNECGDMAGDKLSQFMDAVFDHNSTDLILEVGATLGMRDPCAASWGIDDVALYIKGK